MSRQLATAFFERDLTPAEADALELALESSPETAEALLAGAEQSYRATGLPEPRWEARSPGRLSRAWLWAALLLLGGGVLLALNVERSSAKVSWVSTVDDDMPVLKQERDAKSLLEAYTEDKPEAVVIQAEPASAPSADAAARQGRSLGVVLRLKQAADLKVRVLDAKRRSVRLLHQGRVAAGEQRFEWDGLDEQGRKLPAGDYQVQISGDGFEMERPLRLRQGA